MKRKTMAFLLSAMLAVQPASVVLAEDMLSSGTESTDIVQKTEPQAAAITDDMLTDGGESPNLVGGGTKETHSPQVKTGDVLTGGSVSAATPTEGNEESPEIVDSGECGDNLDWTLDSNGLLIINGIGDMGLAPFDNIKAQIKKVQVSEGVTSIGDFAFADCSGLTSISLPEGIKSIGYYAFHSCSGLTSISLPEGIKSIGDYAFRGCSGLTSISLPEGIKSIGDFTFADCSGLTSISLPEGIKSIGDYAFQGCSGLTSISLPEGIKSIGDYAFRGCSGLTSISLPEEVTSIGDFAFEDCSGLTSISLPEGVTSIGNSAFVGCSSLTSIVLPKSLKYIGNEAFSPDLAYTVYIGTEGERYVIDKGINDSKVTKLCSFNQHTTVPQNIKKKADFDSPGKMDVSCSNKKTSVNNTEVPCEYTGERDIPQVSSAIIYQAETVYTGQPITPEVTVKDVQGTALVKDTDYTVTYPDSSVEPGQYAFTVTLKGKYSGSVEKTYFINKKQQTGFAIKEVGEKTYGDKAFELEAEGGQTDGDITWSVTGDKGVLELNATKGEEVTAAILGAGRVIVTAKKAGDEHYADAADSIDITVAKKEVTIEAEDKSVEQDGAMPEFTYTISGLINEDTVTSAPVFVCRKDGNIITDTKTAGKFEIVPTEAVITNLNNYRITYINGTLTVNAHKWNTSYTTDKPATCVTEGKRSIRCMNPGCHAVKPESETTIPAKGHLWDEGVITKAPTCTEPGIRTCTCERCKWTLRKEVAPTGHTYAGEITKATFTKDGAVSGVCEDCGASVQREVIPQVSDVELSHTEYTYNGTNRQPKVVLKDRTGKELKAEEYSVAYPKESKVPGTYELTITLKGNYYEGTLTKTYTVKKGNQVIGLSDMTKRIDSKTVTLKAEILQGNKTGKFGYQSSNPEVASVTSWGRVTFHKVGKVEITAMTRGSANYNSAQKTITLTVAPVPTAVTKLQSQNPGKLNIQYRANPDADGYQIQYGTSPDMKDAKYAAVENPAIRSYTRKDVKSGETYYVRVRTYNVVDGERIYSNWSGIKSVEVK